MAKIKYQKALGLEVKRGRPRTRGPDPGELRRLYEVEGKSTRDLATALGMSDKKIRSELRLAGVDLRTNAKRSRLRHFNQARLFSDIVLWGVDETARKWKIPERTLKGYLAALRKAAKGE